MICAAHISELIATGLNPFVSPTVGLKVVKPEDLRHPRRPISTETEKDEL